MSQSQADPFVVVADSVSQAEEVADITHLSPTRYLAAAAYTDRIFRNQAIEIAEERFKGRAPELGIDAGLVVKHCYIARRRTVWRDAALSLLLILAFSS